MSTKILAGTSKPVFLFLTIRFDAILEFSIKYDFIEFCRYPGMRTPPPNFKIEKDFLFK